MLNSDLIDNNEKFSVNILPSISIDNLEELIKNGKSVLSFSHIGNIKPENWLSLKSSIPTILFDNTFAIKDNEGEPHKIILTNNEHNFLGKSKKLGKYSYHKKIIVPYHSDIIQAEKGDNILKPHYNTTKNNFENIQSLTDYYIKNKDNIKNILNTLLDNFDKNFIFDRYINRNGILDDFNLNGKNNNEIIQEFYNFLEQKKDILFGKEINNFSGFLLNHNINIVIITVIEYLKTNDNNIYFIAGEKILKYGINNQNIYEKIFNVLKNNSNLNLSENIHLNLVKHHNSSIITIEDEINKKIIELLKNYNEDSFKYRKIKKGEEIKKSSGNPDIKKEIIKKHQLFLEKYKKLIKEVKETITKVNNSHYDLLNKSTDLKMFNEINFLYFEKIKKALN